MDGKLNVVILGGGFGTRLNGSTNLPKGLIETRGSTLLGHVLADLKESMAHVGNISLVTNNLYHQQYLDWVHNNFADLPITILNDQAADNDHRLGAIGDLIFTLHQTRGWQADTLVVPTDTFYSFTISDLLNFYFSRQGFTTVVRQMSPEQIKNRLGCAVMAGDQISSFIEKPEVPPSDYAAIPFYVYPHRILALLPEYQRQGGNIDAPGSIIPWLINQQIPVFAMITTEPTIDVGTPPDLQALHDLDHPSPSTP